MSNDDLFRQIGERLLADVADMRDETPDDDDDGTHTCIHGALQGPRGTVAGRKRQSGFQNLRVLFDTRYVNDESTCREVKQETFDKTSGECALDDVLTPQKAVFLQKVLESAQEYLQTTFAVEPVADFWTFPESRDENGNEMPSLCQSDRLSVPPEYLSQGVAGYDLVVFVTTWPADGNVRAYADACLVDETTGRPVVGFINFSPAKLDAVATTFPTAIHELFHVLGFKRSLFESFRGPNYEELKPHFIIDQLNDQQSLVTKNVVERARAHFGCQTLMGVPLESLGGDIGDHWLKTVMGDDLLTASLAPRFPPLSMISLAAFEDSGWYRVNYQRASAFVFGNKMGCEFLEQSCSGRVSDGYAGCDAEETCSFDQRSYGPCKESRYVGACLLPDTQVSCVDGVDASTGTTLRDTDVIGPDSRCFMASVGAMGVFGGHCFQFECAAGRLSVLLDGKRYTCDNDRAKIVAIAGGGELQCPRSSDLCCSAACLSNGGDCLRGQCVCKPGTEGADCEITLPAFVVRRSDKLPPVVITPKSPIGPAPLVTAAPEPPFFTDLELIGIGVGSALFFLLFLCILCVIVKGARERKKQKNLPERPRTPDFDDVERPRTPDIDPVQRPRTPDLPVHKVNVRERFTAQFGVDSADGATTLFQAEALWDCVAEAADELGFRAGQILDVLDDTDAEWWLCRTADGSEFGNVPKSFFRVVADRSQW